MARIKCFLFAIIISSATSTSIKCKYEKCPDPWNGGRLVDHTMCLYSEESFGPQCNMVSSSSLTGEEQKEILNLHNELRAQVAAGKEARGKNGAQPAGVIGPLEWDYELATIAQRWANQCIFDHDKCRDIGEIEVGQNLGYQSTSGRFNNKFVDIVTSWYDEVEDFDHHLVPKYQWQSGAVTTHYTQLIWANTTRVGCGGVRHITTDNFYTVHLVCNYSPKGNWIGEAVYKLGGQPAEKPHDDSDVEIPPPESSNQPAYDYDIGISLIAPAEYPSDEPVQQKCEYASCIDLKVPGQYKEHTMCRYPSRYLSERCDNVEQSNLNSIEENAILSVHNDRRSQGNSDFETHGLSEDQHNGNIGRLLWNVELAAIAQRWANQCQYFHDECRNVHGLEVGQNVAQISGAENFVEFADTVDGMYYALDHYGSDFPHLRWANTTQVGCGGVKYINSDNALITYLVCNYLSKNDINHKHVRSTSRPESSVTANIDGRIRPDCKYDKCKDLSRSGEYHTHTMCRYPDLTVAAECNDVRRSSLTAAEKQRILDQYNEQRKSDKVSIEKLRWNDELAEVAQRWANQCRVSHDECRDVNAESRVGQNIGMLGEKSSFVYEFSDIVHAWNSGFELQNPESDSNLQIQDSDKPYAQLVSDNTTEVGCGGIKYVDTQGYFNTYLVCNYQPSVRSGLAVVRDIHGSFGTH